MDAFTQRILLLLISSTLFSCAASKNKRETVSLNKGTKLLKIMDDPAYPNSHQSIVIYDLTESLKADIFNKTSGIEINITEPEKLPTPSFPGFRIQNDKVKKYKDEGMYRFAYKYEYDGLLKTSNFYSNLYENTKQEGNLQHGKSEKYWDLELLNGALTIPFKFRQAVFEPDRFFLDAETLTKTRVRLDAVPSTSFNAGYIFGFGSALKTYRPVYNESSNKLVDIDTRLFRASGGLFIGLTTIGLNDRNIVDVPFRRDRTVFGATYGAAFLITYNNFTVGIATGRDRPFDQLFDKWIYHKEWWYGITFGLDIFKFNLF